MKKALKWIGIGLGSLIGLIIIMIAIIYIASEVKIHKTYHVDVEKLDIPTDQASVEEGHRLFISRGCADCHGDNAGGKIFLNDPAVGMLAGPNLTRGKGGVGTKCSEQDFIRAIRYGVHHEGRALIFMPSNEFYHYCDKEIASIVAFLKSTPPVNNTPPPTKPGPVFRALDFFGMTNLFPGTMVMNLGRPKNVEPAPTVEYGKVLAMGCVGCHGEGFSGGAIPGAPSSLPVATNITPHKGNGIGNWTYEEFRNAIRTGVRPNGSKINPFMPWKNFSKLNDTEIKAVWSYLRTVPPKEYGNR